MAEKKEEEKNLRYYGRLRTVPKEALKEIQAGRLKGMSDINPMWRIQAMTATFGPCGIGWKYEIVKQWSEPCGQEVAVFCNINLYIKDGGEWSDAIPGTGGSTFVASERNGLHMSDECYKMALTDAISVAMKFIGVAADVYYAKGVSAFETKYELESYTAQMNAAVNNQFKDAFELIKANIESAPSVEYLKDIKNKNSELLAYKPFVAALTKRFNEISA